MAERQSSLAGVSLTRPSSLKQVKTEQSPNRLPSLRGPRDLTLGGIKKKTFTPSIPVRKDRNKQEIKEEKPNIKKEKRSRSRDSVPRGRGRGRGKAIIESHSIFEARPDSKPSQGRGRASFNDGPKQMQKPTIKMEKIDTAQEKTASEAAMRRLDKGDHSFLDDVQNDEKLKPVVLPLLEANQCKESKVSDAFRSMDKQFILLQIPDSLPGILPSDDDTHLKPETPSASGVKTLDHCSIDALSEGRIGKLQVYKSGRCRLLLKGVHLDLCMGTPTSFTQEIVSVRLPPEESPEGSSGHLSVLGEVSQKVVCVPNMPTLVNS